ncbi:MAG: asparaginase [Aliivibrio sp.]|nr:asparaginase [Aliivibrio sp.]
MVADEKGELRPPKNPADFLEVAPELVDLVDFDFFPIMNKDSTNIVPSDWTKMARSIKEKIDEQKYSGFVIAHGTDTMHFSASALAFAFGRNLNVPIVFTGAQTVPTVKHGDARINLLRAARIAMEDIAEVVISFGDFVFRGCRTQKKDERKFDAFESPAIYPIADITESILIHPSARRKSKEREAVDFRPSFSEGIVQVGLIPGLLPSSLYPLLEGNCTGIVLQSFGAGNVPDWEEYGFGDFIERATKNGTPVIITSQFPANSTFDTHYAPGLSAIRAGAIPTGNMTSSAAMVKFRWALAQATSGTSLNDGISTKQMDIVRKLMDTVFVDEMDEL